MILSGLMLLAGVTPTLADAPTTIRMSWVITPGELAPILFAHPGLARHQGVSYRIETIHFSGGPLSITALAKGEIDLGGLGYATIANAIEGAGIADLEVIGDVEQDGVPGWYSAEYMVLKDSPMRKVEDLKGKTLGTNTVGSMADVAMRAMLRQHGLDDTRDVSIIEVSSPHMKVALSERKVDLGGFVRPFSADPQLRDVARTLFTHAQAMGRAQTSALVARASFVQAHRAALVDFLEDDIRATRWYVDPANHAEAVKIVADFTKISPAALDWAFTKDDWYRSPDALPDTDALQHNVDTLWRLGFLKSRLDISSHVDLSLVREAAARLH